MIDDKVFFTVSRTRLFKSFDGSQVEGINAVLAAYRADYADTITLPQLAYCFATEAHETGYKMQPVQENLNYRTAEGIRKTWPTRFPSNAAAEPYVRNPRALANKVYNGRMGNALGTDDGWNFRGHGLPQITGKGMFAKMTSILQAAGVLGPDEDLVANPELTLRLDVAIAIMFIGMRDGVFTGAKLSRFIGAGPTSREAFRAARVIINGTDKADKIAGEAMIFQAALGVTA